MNRYACSSFVSFFTRPSSRFCFSMREMQDVSLLFCSMILSIWYRIIRLVEVRRLST